MAEDGIAIAHAVDQLHALWPMSIRGVPAGDGVAQAATEAGLGFHSGKRMLLRRIEPIWVR